MPTITFKFKEHVQVQHIARAAEIYHRLIGHHYQREVDSLAGISLMLTEPICIGTEWDIKCTMMQFIDTLIAIANNPTIHDMLYITAKKD